MACCNRVCMFLALITLCIFLESLGSKYMISAVQSVERHFQIGSALSGTLMSADEVGYIPAVVILSYLGSKGNRAKWIGGACLLIAASDALVGSTNFIFHRKEPILNKTTIDEILNPNLQDVSHEQLLMHGKIQKGLGAPAVDYLNARLDGEDPTPPMEEELAKINPKLKKQFDKLIADQITLDVCFEGLRKIASAPPSEAERGQVLRKMQAPAGYCDAKINELKALYQKSKCEQSPTNRGAVGFMFICLMLIGIGNSVPWTLGVPLLDDNVKKTDMPLMFGLMIIVKKLGPILSFLIGAGMTKLHVTLKTPEGLTEKDPRWIGAWWLGYFLIAAALILPSLALFCFPEDPVEVSDKEKAKKRIRLSLKDKNLIRDPSVETGFKASIKRFGVSLLACLKSPIYTGSVIGRVLDIFAAKGYFAFLPKFIDNHYGYPASKANMIIGFGGVMIAIVSVLGSVVIMKRFKLERRRAAAFVGLISVVVCILTTVKTAFGCTSVTNQLGPIGQANNFNFSSSCNEACYCDPIKIKPVCSKTGQIYYSPCVAGCKQGKQGLYSRCECIDEGTTATRENCSDDCSTMLWVYMGMLMFIAFIQSLTTMPSLLIVIRSVPPIHRSVAIGFLTFIVSIGTLLAPIIFGRIIDAACILWEKTCSGSAGSCYIYDPWKLRAGCVT